MSLTIEAVQSVSEQPLLLQEYFDRAVRQWPDEPAIEVPPGPGRPHRTQLSYRELLLRAEAATETLTGLVPAGGIVAVVLPRTGHLLYTMQVAAVKAGVAYLCVDPKGPDELLRQVLDDSGATVVITDHDGRQRAAMVGYRGPVLLAEDLAGAAPANRAVGRPTAPDDVAYVIYTSGTTGQPKGVLISHRGIANLIRSDLQAFRLGPGDRVAQGSSAAYDSSVEEIWMALSCGATVVLLDDDTARLGPDLVPWLHRERITVLCPPPTLLRTTGCQSPRTELPHLRLLYVGGEALPQDVADLWSRGRRMVNGYGPTECTVTCLRSDIVAGQPVTIGAAIQGMRALVLDHALEPTAVGASGELCMAGAGLALGYHNQPELTAAKFVDHPRFGRIYRTGDLVRAEPDGTLSYHGRIDSQVKIRGYRVELESIEEQLTRCPGVREAACQVQGSAANQLLAAHIVPVDPHRPPDPAALIGQLRQVLPEFMVPAVIGTLSELPRGTSGKIRRSDLPVLSVAVRDSDTDLVRPRTPVEQRIADAVSQVLPSVAEVSVTADFFTGLGGSSLQAAMLVSLLRKDPGTDGITVRDIYEARTIAELARRTQSQPAEHQPAEPPRPARSAGRAAHRRIGAYPIGVTLAQAGWILLEILVAAPVAYLTVFQLVPWVVDRIGLIPLVVLVPLLLAPLSLAWTAVSVLLAVLAKRVLIGQFRPTRVPVWSEYYFRVWVVQHLVRMIPWGTLAGTEFQCRALRALGARIGQRVHIHRGVNLVQGGWDLLNIGDDVTLHQDSAIRLVQLDQGHLVIGPVTVDSGATLDVRAGLGPYTRMGRDSWLSALSSLPSGGRIGARERWDGVPARPAGTAPRPPDCPAGGRRLSPFQHGIAMIVSRTLLSWALALPSTIITVVAIALMRPTYASLLAAFSHPLASLSLLGFITTMVCLMLAGTVFLQAGAARALGRIEAGVIDRWGLAYIRVWLKTGLVDSAGTWLSGGLYWPVWLRLAGMRVGPDCEISTIIDVVPELVDIGPHTFFADGIYLGGPRIQRGRVTLGAVRLQGNTFLGNHAVIPAGQQLPPDLLIGICTVSDDRRMRQGSSWFGHPAFELPVREIVECDRRLTYDPTTYMVVRRMFWEWLRFALPVVPMAVFATWISWISAAEGSLSLVALLAVGAPAISLVTALLPCLVVLAMKWALLGRVRPGIHPLWSSWCSRWDFLYVAWGFVAGRLLGALEGTLLLPLYLRRMGMKIGKRVVLGGGFAQVVDPDMLTIEDGATVHAMFQAHTFEDRVLKIGPVRVGSRSTLAAATVPLYGADIGDSTHVAAHSVVMKHEHLQPGLRYEGAPTRAALPRP